MKVVKRCSKEEIEDYWLIMALEKDHGHNLGLSFLFLQPFDM
jgi:hypothetical protein